MNVPVKICPPYNHGVKKTYKKIKSESMSKAVSFRDRRVSSVRLERNSKVAAKKFLRVVAKYLLSGSNRRPTQVVSRVVKDSIVSNGCWSSFEIKNDVTGKNVSWKSEKQFLDRVERQIHRVTGLKVNRQSAFDDVKYVASGCEGVSSRLEGAPGYVSRAKDPRAASVAHLNMAHLVPGSKFLIPKSQLTTVFTSPGYNQVIMVEEEQRLYKWLDQHNINDLDCVIEVDLVPADPSHPSFTEIVNEAISEMGSSACPELGKSALSYVRSIGIPVVRSFSAIYTNKKDTSQTFSIVLGVDKAFSLSRRHSGSSLIKAGKSRMSINSSLTKKVFPLRVTPASSRYLSVAKTNSSQRAFGKVLLKIEPPPKCPCF